MHLQIRRALTASVLPMVCLTAFAQKTVTGTVKDAKGEPLIGVTVFVDGKPGSITDIDGNFSIPNASPSSKVKVSYIGYKEQTVTLGNSSNLSIVLQEDNAQLDEVVVVGYGTIKKNDLTGSVSSIDTEKLNAKGASSVIENLQGSVPGVSITQSSGRVGGGFDIEIRGKSSTNSDTKPIYVIDGVICDDMDFLNPQDIERIDVLKDASSTAIYGSRATAGVVMVTTKGGASIKHGKEKAHISYDGYYGISKVARMPDFMDGQGFYNYRFLRFLNANDIQSGRPGYTLGGWGQMALETPRGTSALKEALASGNTYDWPDLVTKNGHQQNHYLAVSGSTGKTSYHMGVGFQSEDGIYKGDKSKKINFKGSLDSDVTKWLTAGFSVNMARMENDYAEDDAIKEAYKTTPFSAPYDKDGNLYEKPGYTLGGGGPFETIQNYNLSQTVNPLLLLNASEKNRETWRLMGNAYLNFKLYKGLTFKTTFSPDFSYYREGEFLDVTPDRTETTSTKASKRSFNWTWDNILTYDNTFAEKHHVNVMGLFSMLQENVESDNLVYKNTLDGTKWWNLNTGTYNTDDSNNAYSEWSMMSYALRANYTYAGKYMVTGTVRWDGSSRFADGNRWGCFPSAALAWRMSEEEWMKTDWLSNLKLRLSYGVTGNCSGIGNYDTQVSVSGPITYPFGSVYSNGFYPSGIVNKDLTWETSNEINFGVDFGFFNNRLSGSVDIYQKDSKDLLFGVQLPLEAGTDKEGNPVTMSTNVGKVRNRGVEVALSGVIIDTKDWNWTANLTFASNKNEVREINGLGGDMPSSNLFIGKSFNNVNGYEWTGIVSDRMMTVPDNDIAKLKGLKPGTQMSEADYYYKCYGWTEGSAIIDDVNGDGKFDSSDRKVWSSDPAWTGSFSTTLSYKNWDLSASLYTKQDYKVSSEFLGEYLDQGQRGKGRLSQVFYIPAGTLIDCDGLNADGTYRNPVYQQNTHYGKYPFPSQSYQASTSNSYYSESCKYVDASYVKVKNITLGYTFPKKWLGKVGIEKLRLYCTVTNPFVWSDYKGFDPEWADASLKKDGPSTVTWQFGANIKF